MLGNILGNIQIGMPQTADGVLTVFPLTAPHPPDRGSLTLDEALEQGRVEVVESGRVPEVVVLVKGDRPVLIIEGEVLTGGWQNRTVNISLLLDPGKKHPIPVSCVESGRWSARPSRRSRVPSGMPSPPEPAPVAFEAAPCVAPYELRRSKTRKVTRSLRLRKVPQSDQGEVWACVDAYLEQTGTAAPTRDVTAFASRYLPSVDALLKSIEPLPSQVGAVVAVGGRVVALEVVDHPETWRRVCAKVLRGYALDALDVRGPADRPGVPSLEAAGAFLEDVTRAFERAAVVPVPTGLGEHWLPEAAGGAVQGFALVHEKTLYHLWAFPTEDAR